MDTNKKITHLSLCSGYEGIGLGLRSVLPNLREIAYVEREGFPVANLGCKDGRGKLDAAPVFTDVKTFPYGKFRGCVDILSGGFPCQPFSAAGKRQATEDPRHLFPYIADGIRECQPRIVFLENVQGILSCKTADGEPVLQYVLRELEGLGYRATAGIFSAEEVGAPHQRKRVFIMAYRNSVRHDGGGSYPTEMVDGAYRSKHSQEPNSPWYGAKLKDAVETHEQNWPTATTRDWKDTNATVPPSRANPSKQTLGQRVAHVGLQDQANPNTNGKNQESWPTPRANKVHPEITEKNRDHLANRKKANLEEDIAGHCGKATGKLNPNWVEHLMGLPAGWTDLGSWETE